MDKDLICSYIYSFKSKLYDLLDKKIEDTIGDTDVYNLYLTIDVNEFFNEIEDLAEDVCEEVCNEN